MHRLRGSSPSDGERGSAIIIALVVLTVIGTIIASSLSYLRSSLASTTIATRPARNSNASADAAMQTAIAYLRAHPSAATDLGLPCPASSLQYPGDTGAVTVNFCPQGGGGAPAVNSLAALLTLGANKKEAGLTAGAPGDLVVNGDTFSNATLTAATSSRLVVHSGTVWARQACAGTIVVDAGAPAPTCNFAGATPADAVDPAYKAAIAKSPKNGAGSCAAGVATIGPGTWTLKNLQKALGACTTVWLKPGAFYLNLGNKAWTAKGLKIIGGTPSQASLPTAPFPGGCDANAPGTQLIFGGASQIALTQGSTLDLCGLDTLEGVNTVKLAMVGLTAKLGGMAKQSGCVIQVNKCAVLQATGAQTGINIAGTAYLPAAKLDFQPSGGRIAITGSLAARTFNVDPAAASPSVTIGTAGAPASGGNVVLTASIGGVNWLAARVAVPAGANPVPTISDWVLQH